MTGTGACIFAAFDTESAARRVADAAEGRWQVIVARGRNRSPLHETLQALREN
jgi:4-diphosphocytidyl-2-C-methyl-D-erythritol kinase